MYCARSPQPSLQWQHSGEKWVMASYYADMTLSFSFWIHCRIWEVPSDGITQAADVMTKAQHPTFLSTEIIVVNASRVLCCSNDLSFMWKARYQIPHSCRFHPLSWCPLTCTCTQIQLSLQETKLKLETEEDWGSRVDRNIPIFLHAYTNFQLRPVSEQVCLDRLTKQLLTQWSIERWAKALL